MTRIKRAFIVILTILASAVCSLPQSRSQEASDSSIADIAIFPHADSVIVFASTPRRGLWTSQDGAQSWHKSAIILTRGDAITNLFYASGIRISQTPFEIIPSADPALDASGVLFAGTQKSGLYYSTDKGKTWSRFASTGLPKYAWITDIIVNKEGRIFIGTASDGIFSFGSLRILRSPFKLWIRIDPIKNADLTIHQLVLDPQDPRAFFGVAPDRIYRFDPRKGWQLISALNFPLANTLLVDPRNSKILYLGSTMGLAVSSDGGVTWPMKTLQSMSITSLAGSGKDPIILHAGTSEGRLFTSLDGGKRWRSEIELPSNGSVNVLASLPGDSSIHLAGTADGLYITRDWGTDWKPNLLAPHGLSSSIKLTVGFVAGGCILTFAYLSIRHFKRVRRSAPRRACHKEIKIPDDTAFTTQIQEAFDSLKRSENQNALLTARMRTIYVDYRQNLFSILQTRNDYLVGPPGGGKTTLLLRCFTECSQPPKPQTRKMKAGDGSPYAVYITMQELELAGLSLRGQTEKIEKQFTQEMSKCMSKQLPCYPKTFAKKIKGAFGANLQIDDLQDFTKKINILQDERCVTAVYLLIDDYSRLDRELQADLAAVLRRLILSEHHIFVKIAVVETDFDLGEMELQRDIFRLSLGIVDGSPDPSGISEDAIHTVRKLLDYRILESTNNAFSFDDIMMDDREEILRTLIAGANGIPRSMGVILSRSWANALRSGRKNIKSADLAGLSESRMSIRSM